MFDNEYDLAKAVIKGMSVRSEAGEYTLERFIFNCAYPSSMNLGKKLFQYYTKSLSMKVFQGFQYSTTMSGNILSSILPKTLFARGFRQFSKNRLT